MDSNETPQTPKKKPQRNIFTVLFLLMCLVGSAVAGAMFASSSVFDPKDPVRRIIGSDTSEELIKATDKSIVLIMGVDKRKDDVGRSDTLMIATVDPRLDQATLLSVPRDTRVKIRGLGYDKINAAFAYGGVALTESTVENFLGIDIDHYITIDTSSFVKIIDAIGGVDIDVEKRMFYEDPWDDDGGLVIDLYPGQQHMDGKTAVTYVRYRDSEGDIGRVKRQQAFMSACFDKVMSPEIVPRIPKIVREVIDAVETDMSLRQLLEFAGALKAAAQNGLETDMVPGYPLYIDDISYWIPDVELLRMSVANALGITIDPYLRERFERDAREYKESIPSGARDVPEGQDRIGKPVHESRDRRRTIERRSTIDERSSYSEGRHSDTRSDSVDIRNYDDSRTDSNDDRLYDSSRSDSVESRRYDDTRTDSTNSRRYDDTRTDSTDSRRYDDTRTDSTDSRRYDDTRTDSTNSRRYDDTRTDSTDSRREDIRIERRNIPDIDETLNEPTRDSAPKTRYD